MRAFANRGYDPWIGRRLGALAVAAGFKDIDEQVEAETDRRFAPGSLGHAMAHLFGAYLLGPGRLKAEEYVTRLADLERCADEAALVYGVTRYLCLAEA